MEVPPTYGYLFLGPYSTDHGILRFILGTPLLGNYKMGFRVGLLRNRNCKRPSQHTEVWGLGL